MTETDPPRIWVTIPYCHSWEGHPAGLDLAAAYRAYMSRFGLDDWILLLDHDVMHCSRRWFQLLEAAIAEHQDSDVGAFTAMQNRLIPRASAWQIAPEVDYKDNDMERHWRVGYARLEQYWTQTVDVTWIDESHKKAEIHYKPMSGFFMCIRKRAWVEARCLQGKAQFYHCDHDIHKALREAGWRVLLLPGLYLYHWNRFNRHLSARNERGDV